MASECGPVEEWNECRPSRGRPLLQPWGFRLRRFLRESRRCGTCPSAWENPRMRLVELSWQAQIDYSGCGMGDGDLEFKLTACLKGEDGVLLRRNGDSVVRGRLKVPVLQCRQALFVDVRAKALQHGFADDLPSFIDRDFDDLFALRGRPLPGVDYGVGSRDGQCRTNLVTVDWATGNTSVGKSGKRSMTKL